MNGIWIHDKNSWHISAGWASSDWNLKIIARNITRWNWRSSRQDMRSRYYDTHQIIYDGNSHALVLISATYTIGFGKNVKRDNEPSVTNSASSGILK